MPTPSFLAGAAGRALPGLLLSILAEEDPRGRVPPVVRMQLPNMGVDGGWEGGFAPGTADGGRRLRLVGWGRDE